LATSRKALRPSPCSAICESPVRLGKFIISVSLRADALTVFRLDRSSFSDHSTHSAREEFENRGADVIDPWMGFSDADTIAADLSWPLPSVLNCTLMNSPLS
jgi:hypothetical protein